MESYDDEIESVLRIASQFVFESEMILALPFDYGPCTGHSFREIGIGRS
jgi:hypothetical protein